MQIRNSIPAACFALGFFCAALTPTASMATPLNPSDTYVQLFEWSWNDIATECTQWLGPQGYGAVQISPPGASKNANGWWDVYQPINYGNLTSRMGTLAQLQNMINTCHAAGVRVYADIVTNQLGDQSSAADGVATDGSSWDASSLSYPQFGSSDFHNNTPGECSNADGNIDNPDYGSPGNRNNVMFCRLGGLPDLATESSHVQSVIVAYLNTLLGMGVDGFRLDAAKHQQPAALQSILNAVKSAHPTTNADESIWVTQEVIGDGNVVRSDYFPTGTINEFQFTYAMRDIFRGNNGLSLSSIPGVMGTYGNYGGTWGFVQPQNATVFVDDWDTERDSSQSLNGSNYISGQINDTNGTKRFELAEIFMLATPYGQAHVQSGYRFSNSNADRPTASPYSNGVAQINVVWDFIHRWGDISNMVKFRSYTHGQNVSNWATGTANQIAFSRGNLGFVAINNDNVAWNATLYTGLPSGTYCNVVHGNVSGSTCTGDSVFVNSNGYATISLPANGGATVPALAIYTGQTLSGGSGGCTVTLNIANANTSYGQNLYVAGNQTALGNWTASSAFPLAIQGSGANATWSGTVTLPASTAIQYKYILYNPSTGAVTWEANQSTSSGNRQATTCASGSVSYNDGNF
jgi:alpha-amylase